MSEELLKRCDELVLLYRQGVKSVYRRMHEILVLACAEGIRGSQQAYGNLFSQVSFICKAKGLSAREKAAIQTMRRHSNRNEHIEEEAFLMDVWALKLFIAKVFDVRTSPCPSKGGGNQPINPSTHQPINSSTKKRIRCIVNSFDDEAIHVTIDGDIGDEQLKVSYKGIYDNEDHSYLKRLLREGMQLNLLDCKEDQGMVQPSLVVVEPDFLLDISSVAALFTDYGHHPLSYTINRMKPRANSNAILLGNFASSALDDIINDPNFNLNNTISNSFREQALQFCTCHGFDATQFLRDAHTQSANLREHVAALFKRSDSDRRKDINRERVILEPSFVCESLGLQGRADLLTSDFQLLAEQKSGKNYNIESGRSGHQHKEDHYVQLILYLGVLRYNYGVNHNNIDTQLIYSRYDAKKGLVDVGFYRPLFLEAIKLRNLIVCYEYYIANHGFGSITRFLTSDIVNEQRRNDRFFEQYIRPQAEAVTAPLHRMQPLEKAYFERMMTFVYREQLAAKVGIQDGHSTAAADLWNMPLHEKQDSGNIFINLKLTDKECSAPGSGYDLLTFSVPDYGNDFLPNFRRGDMVYAYAYRDKPDVRHNILYKATITTILNSKIRVKLTDGQQNKNIFRSDATYAIEHASGDIVTASSIRSLHTFITSPLSRRQLLLGQRQPESDTSLQLSQSYSDTYDDILLRIKQSKDYFLLVGPPGTGKTSMALRFMVMEELGYEVATLSGDEGATLSGYKGATLSGDENLITSKPHNLITSKPQNLITSNPQILITSYTNRAVDEICSMLTDAGIDFLRLGSENSCDPRFHNNLLETALGDKPKLSVIQERIVQCRVIVGTTSTLQSRPFIFQLKHFSLAIVDEASQILEPNIIGLLSAHNENNQCCIDRFVLIGDYKQLPAVVQQDENHSRVTEKELQDICLADCRLSLFERLIHWEQLQGRKQFVGILRRQGRMHPDIAAFPNEMFYCEEKLEPVPCQHQLDTSLNYSAPSLDLIDDLLKQQRMLFIPAAPEEAGDTSDKANASEAQVVADILRRIVRFYGNDFDPDHTVGVIVPYRNQIAMIRREIEKLDLPILQGISIDTVERYQGSQRDVIIYSFTIRRLSQLGFLTGNCFTENGRVIDRKLNVAITRARKQMIMTGNPDILNHNNIFRKLIENYNITTKLK